MLLWWPMCDVRAKKKVSRREAMYFRHRGVEESDLIFQDPVKYQ